MGDEEKVRRQSRAEGATYLRAKTQENKGQRKWKEGIESNIAVEIGRV